MLRQQNPFTKVYQLCNNGDPNHKTNCLPEFPRCIDMELTNKCNFNCLMCPTGVGSVSRCKGFMTDEVFFSILEEISRYKTPVRFIRWGEPLLHSRLTNYIRQLKARGSLVHLNTNGSLMTEKIMEDLLESGLDSIKFSFQGVDRKSYLEMRGIDMFDELVNKVRLLCRKRAQANHPYIHVSTTITYETRSQVSLFRELLGNHVDLLTVGRTVLDCIDPKLTSLSDEKKAILKHLKNCESVVKKHPNCPEVFDKLSVNWDGTVSACTSDYDNQMLIGDVKLTSLKDIWKNEKLSSYRNILLQNEHHKLPLCSRCYDYHGLQTPGLQQT